MIFKFILIYVCYCRYKHKQMQIVFISFLYESQLHGSLSYLELKDAAYLAFYFSHFHIVLPNWEKLFTSTFE